VATFGLIALGIPIAVSRSALLVAIVVLAVFLIDVDRATRLRSLTVIGFFLVMVFLFVPGLLGTLRGYVFAGQSDSSVSTRTGDYAAVAHYLRESPWLGRGASTFLPRLRVLDNQYLMTLVETGLIGVLGFLLLFGLPIWLGSASRTRFTEVSDRQLSRVFVAVGVAVLVASTTFDSLSFPMFTLFSAMLIGLCGQHWTRSSDSRPDRSNVEGGPPRMIGHSQLDRQGWPGTRARAVRRRLVETP
jgi:O-antigen ligase